MFHYSESLNWAACGPQVGHRCPKYKAIAILLKTVLQFYYIFFKCFHCILCLQTKLQIIVTFSSVMEQIQKRKQGLLDQLDSMERSWSLSLRKQCEQIAEVEH